MTWRPFTKEYLIKDKVKFLDNINKEQNRTAKGCSSYQRSRYLICLFVCLWIFVILQFFYNTIQQQPTKLTVFLFSHCELRSLPLIKSNAGARLPPDRYSLTAQLTIDWKTERQRPSCQISRFQFLKQINKFEIQRLTSFLVALNYRIDRSRLVDEMITTRADRSLSGAGDWSHPEPRKDFQKHKA